jgi:C1A family cysteine protease
MNIVSDSLLEMKSALASGYPFSIGVAIYQSFESQSVALSGMVPMPKTHSEQMLGGHAMSVVGYDDSKSCFLVRNSWGHGWGIGGHCWMPYEYLTSPSLTSDIWALETVPKTFKTPPPVVSDKPAKCATPRSCIIA